ncbi:MAG: acetylornithine deacetylase [Verrucomicrobiota bacterium]|nr:MAG: acetylornithine deacetylase [Verrucomicrobiota bacterium]
MVSQVVQLLRDLIALPSVNAAFLPPGDARAGEAKVTDYLVKRAAMARLDIERQPVTPESNNLIVRLQPLGQARHRIILAPHLDTVGGDDPKMFRPIKKGNKLHGRGACDTKGSVAAMFRALENVANRKKRPSETEIFFVGLMDEECNQTGSRAFANLRMKADLALVGEPTRCKVVTAHKGDLWLRLTATGKAAHGARPELGRNAVHALAQCINPIETDYAALLRKRRHPVLGHATINTGTIRGGAQPNIVPYHCEADLDRRTLPGETFAKIRRELLGVLARRGLKAKLIDVKGYTCPALETNPGLPWVRDFMRSARQKKPLGVDYYCDAANLAGAGIPTVVWGPGDIAQAHTADEWITIEQLERGTDMLTRFLLSLP